MQQHCGTLICVVLHGRHLTLKRTHDTQDPVAEVRIDGTRLRTLPDRRGGSAPLWDEQMQFEIVDDGTSPHTLELVCYATDKEPDYIGRTAIDLTPALTQRQYDRWLSLTHQGQCTGHVYVELTYYPLPQPLVIASPASASPTPPTPSHQHVAHDTMDAVDATQALASPSPVRTRSVTAPTYASSPPPAQPRRLPPPPHTSIPTPPKSSPRFVAPIPGTP